MFVNNTNYSIIDVKIKTQAQGEAKIVSLDKKVADKIAPHSSKSLTGKLGGYFENSSIDDEDWTEWNIELVCEDSKGNTRYFYLTMEFNNQHSDGPALSLWPKTSELSKQNSKFIFKANGKNIVLCVEIYTKNGKCYNMYEFDFQEMWIETPNGRTMITI